MVDQLLTTGDVADALGVSRVTVWRMVRDGDGPVEPVGRAGRHGPFLFRRDDVKRAADQLARDAVERADMVAGR